MAKITKEPFNFGHIDFLQAAGFMFDFRRDLAVTLAAIKEGSKLMGRSFAGGDVDAMARWVEEKNRDGYNIYFHVNNLNDACKDKKAKKRDISSVHAFHVDIDDPSEDALARIEAFPIKPSVVLFSGGGYQVFWVLSNPLVDLDKAEAINAGLAQELGGDNCQNVDRIMRVPETVNWPNAKKRKSGRVPAKAYVLPEYTDFSRVHRPEELEVYAVPKSTELEAVHRSEVPEYSLISVKDLDLPKGSLTDVIVIGDDPDNPRSSKKPRFPSRSEAHFSVCCSLARLGWDAGTIAGVIVNPAHGISEAILEKPNPKEYAYRQAEKAIAFVAGSTWPETYKSGAPKPSLINAIVGLARLGFNYSNDLFHNRKKIDGHALQAYQGDLSDDGTAFLRKLYVDTFGFDPGKQHLHDALQISCVENSFHPIIDYFNGLAWDGKPRLETILIDYFGAEDTDLNRAIGKIFLVAVARRIKSPGCKFDTMIVLEGKQGSGKSTALVILAGEENFSDQTLFGQTPQQQAEAMEGVMIFEIAELSGLKHSDISSVKATITRTEDRLRPEYGRFKERWPRQCIFVGTTNDDTYLKDATGNRRFLPVMTGEIDLKALEKDRDQLFAEAVLLEAKGASITLPKELWDVAAVEQEKRLPTDPWEDILAGAKGDVVNGIERISSASLVGEAYLRLPTSQLYDHTSKRLAKVMRKLGWEGPKTVRIGGEPVRGYSRKVERHDDPNF